jgi:hypothetical protein
VAILAVILYLVARTRANDSGAPSETTSSAGLPAVSVAPVPRTAEADKYCPDFLAKLPNELDGLPRRAVDAQDAYVQAFGNPAVVVQCGVPRPTAFVVGSEPILITGPNQQNGVQWFLDGTTSTAVDRDVYVSVVVPEGGDLQGVLQDLTAVITQVLPEHPIDPAPAPSASSIPTAATSSSTSAADPTSTASPASRPS